MRYSKIDKDLSLQKKIKEMLLNHSTPTAIGKQINIAKDTVKKYLTSKDLPIFSREDENDKKNEKSHILFIEDFKISNSITSSRKKFKITHDKAHKLLKQHDLVAKTRQEAALDKTLSLEEAQSRLPNQNNKVTEFKDGKYTIEASDGFIYHKTSAKLIQGDPRGKNGTKKDTSEIARRLSNIGYHFIESSFTAAKEPMSAIHLACGKTRINRLANFFTQACHCERTHVKIDNKTVRSDISKTKSTSTETNKFNNFMTMQDKELVFRLHSENKTNIEIAVEVKRSSTAVRLLLKKHGLTSNVIKVDRSRPCKMCGTVFTPKSYDGPKKDKYTNCSPECGKRSLIESKIKYSEEDIEEVIRLKKLFITNKDIEKITGVNINKIKEIAKDNNLHLSPEQAQENAYTKKLEKNSDCMEDMRNIYSEQMKKKNKKNVKIIKKHLKEDPKKAMIDICEDEKWSYGSTLRKLKNTDNSDLCSDKTKRRGFEEIARILDKKTENLIPTDKFGNIDKDSDIVEGYDIVEDSFERASMPFEAIHRKCERTRKASITHFVKHPCGFCTNKGISKAETEVFDFVRDCLGPEVEVEQSNRTVLKPKELDIYVPKMKFSLEYCGLYWHNELSPTPRLRSYHYDKMKQCNEQGIRLVTIFEDEWTDRQFQVKSFLKSILGVCKQRVFARKCEMREVEKTIARDFLEAYHIQGKTSFKIAFGLYYEDELLGLVTGNVHHRQKGDDAPFVLNRLVFKDEVLIVGGASKLLKKLITHARENGYKKLISWSDNRWSEGNVYRKTGFSLEGELAPDYSYFDSVGLGRQSKQSNKKKNLIKKGAIGTMEMTERELALTLGLYRIHDCGKLRWTIDL